MIFKLTYRTRLRLKSKKKEKKCIKVHVFLSSLASIRAQPIKSITKRNHEILTKQYEKTNTYQFNKEKFHMSK